MHTVPMEALSFNSKTHEYSDHQGPIPSVTQILARAGVCDFSFVEEEKRRRSMARGTSVHWMTRLDDEGALNYRQLSKRMAGYRKAWRNYRKNNAFEIIAIEMPCHLPQFRVAGTPDRIVKLSSGAFAVIDIKSGPILEWVRFQLAPYAIMAREDLAMRGLIKPRFVLPRHILRIAVAVREDGTYTSKQYPPSDWIIDWAKFCFWMKEGERVSGN